MGYYVETRCDGLPWTREGCNERSSGRFIPYATKPLAREAVRSRREDRHLFDDPMWATSEYRIVKSRGGGGHWVRPVPAKVRLNRVNGEVFLRTNFRDLKEVLTAASLHCHDSIKEQMGKKGLKGADAVAAAEMEAYSRGLLRFIDGIDCLMDQDLRPYLYEDPLSLPKGSKKQRRREVDGQVHERRLLDQMIAEMVTERRRRKSGDDPDSAPP